MKPVTRNAGDQNTVRLIGGRWRGRKIHFPDGEGLRPTPARVRETLFNWLMHDVRDARVLDLFAGSGALAFEALSRGAREAVWVDRAAAVCTRLTDELAKLADTNTTTRTKILKRDALDYISHPADAPFDIVFLDPPFHQNLLATCSAHLDANGFLRAGSLIYVEAESTPNAMQLPTTWRLHRSSKTGQVCHSLFVKEGTPDKPVPCPAKAAPRTH